MKNVLFNRKFVYCGKTIETDRLSSMSPEVALYIDGRAVGEFMQAFANHEIAVEFAQDLISEGEME